MSPREPAAVAVSGGILTNLKEMALFHCTFLALKARNDRTLRLGPEEHNLRSERKLFQAYVFAIPCATF